MTDGLAADRRHGARARTAWIALAAALPLAAQGDAGEHDRLLDALCAASDPALVDDLFQDYLALPPLADDAVGGHLARLAAAVDRSPRSALFPLCNPVLEMAWWTLDRHGKGARATPDARVDALLELDPVRRSGVWSDVLATAAASSDACVRVAALAVATAIGVPEDGERRLEVAHNRTWENRQPSLLAPELRLAALLREAARPGSEPTTRAWALSLASCLDADWVETALADGFAAAHPSVRSAAIAGWVTRYRLARRAPDWTLPQVAALARACGSGNSAAGELLIVHAGRAGIDEVRAHLSDEAWCANLPPSVLARLLRRFPTPSPHNARRLRAATATSWGEDARDMLRGAWAAGDDLDGAALAGRFPDRPSNGLVECLAGDPLRPATELAESVRGTGADRSLWLLAAVRVGVEDRPRFGEAEELERDVWEVLRSGRAADLVDLADWLVRLGPGLADFALLQLLGAIHDDRDARLRACQNHELMTALRETYDPFTCPEIARLRCLLAHAGK